ncbi:MAG: ATP-binding cassette domain-containing protein [Planctomycetota bacterium]|nr:ATP-binding cassette domain-containing protein [Planctomycetota bacterium]
MSDSVLELQNVCKTYGDFTAVDDVSFTIPAGMVYGFLGPNGAGKTTTIRMILEIIKPTKGSISVFGKPSALAVRERIGYLPEEKGLYKKMRAWSIIAYFATLKGMDRKAAKRRAYELLERYGLKDFADAKTEALSKGMGQKVQVLASIAHDPELIILDEPFSGLDPVNQEVMEEVIRDLKERGRTVLFSTHVMSHAERICDRILLIAGGKKVLDDTIDGARKTIPRRVRVASADPLDFLAELDAVVGLVPAETIVAIGSEKLLTFDAQLSDKGEPIDVVKACLERGVHLERFDYSPPSLHEVFVELVGDKAKEASFR